MSIFIFLAVIVILSSTVFTLKKVEVRFLSETNVLTNKETEIVNNVEFKYNESIFFSNKKAYTKQLEKNNPYLQVVNIESKFPNTLVINAVERQESFVLKMSPNNYLVLDKNLKVLRTLNVYQSSSTNPIEIKNSGITNQEVEVGDFITTQDDYITQIFNCFLEWTDDTLTTTQRVNLLKQKITSIELDYEKPNRLLVNMRSGVQIEIDNSKVQLSDKLNLAFSFYDTKKDKNGNDVDYTQNGIILITETNDKIYGLYNPANN